ncbi:glucose PTS transporter transcription antiterminator GlcT [Paenibacillus solani]|uniref:PtsGHI operon antiterminator n=1 Tax=Paenibacillus solani TaxID=1705565 RepID=A0A0M1P1D8_9BACL|nr:PRD domain-containing protein [Paenibacillus solani]KOR88286.1 PtsGHI operon antiterminator [Paenibacillus solani]
MSSLQVAKVLNNNVIIANHPLHGEVVVIGKGIGFNRKTKDRIPDSAAEKMFILTKPEEQEQYKQLVPHIDEKLIEAMNDIILNAVKSSDAPLNEHIHIALTDHIAFAIKRHAQGLYIHNPFLYETREMYPEAYEMAEYAVDTIREKLGVDLGEEEIGFIALHFHSALTNQHISEVRKHSELIADLVHTVEQQLDFTIPRDTLDYSRLLTHLRFAIERVRRGEAVTEISSLDGLLKREYPEIYSLAWKLTKIMEQRLKKPVYPAEAGYLTIHLERLVQRKEQND